ncbi:MAG: methionyl-tRNA formyltransferase [Bacteroidetes bacterium]|nr:methionyl-tRNA formyltransferase [Bacteroidota bacterium]
MSLRIIYMGSPEFAVEPANLLLNNGYQVVAVVTVPDKPAGRGQKISISPVKEFALQHHIPVLQPENLSDPHFLETLRSYHADLNIVVAFRILPETVWAMPPLGTFNLHASLLPQYRGAAPINWAIINGETETGVTTFFLDHKIDTGRIIFSEKIPIGPDETFGELHDKLKVAGAELVIKTVRAVEMNVYTSTDQSSMTDIGAMLKKAPKIHKEDCRINWDMSAIHICNLIRGLSPQPGAFTELVSPHGEHFFIKIFRTFAITTAHDHPHRQIITDKNNQFAVGAKDGIIYISELQVASRKKMTTGEFLKGFHLTDEWRIS